MPVYLDHAASTPLHPEVLDAMLSHLRDSCANPSGAHMMAREARKAIDEARDTMAEVLGAEPREIVFTGGGTESDNLAVLGVHDRCGGVLVASSTEHHAVLAPVEARGGRLVLVDGDGVLDLSSLDAVLDDVAAAGEAVTLVSVMLVNNEVGTIQPVSGVARRVHRRLPGAVVHTDAVQALTWVDVPALTADVDLLSVSAHKFGGPKGVGALVIRERVNDRLAARSMGGGQERERRSGTQNVAGIVGMAVAARISADRRAVAVERISKLRDRMVAGLLASVADAVEVGVGAPRAAGIANICFEGVDSESLLFLLERAGVCASAASSCASGAQEPSHVLTAMGVSPSLARGALRLSLGWSSTDADVDAVLAAVPPAVERLRAFA